MTVSCSPLRFSSPSGHCASQTACVCTQRCRVKHRACLVYFVTIHMRTLGTRDGIIHHDHSTVSRPYQASTYALFSSFVPGLSLQVTLLCLGFGVVGRRICAQPLDGWGVRHASLRHTIDIQRHF